jgi:hypothetical protein
MWQPWIGSGYEARRLLVLGESCYAWEEDGQVKEPQPDHPVVMARYAMTAFPRRQHTLDMISRGICGKYAPSLTEVTAAWEDIQGLRMRFRVDFAQSSLAIQPGA